MYVVHLILAADDAGVVVVIWPQFDVVAVQVDPFQRGLVLDANSGDLPVLHLRLDADGH